jgi:hypothetical protein
MELFGPSASGVSVFDATARVVKAVTHLLRAVDQVPEELKSLAQQLQSLHILLETLKSFDSNLIKFQFSESLTALPFTLYTADALVARLERSCEKYKGQHGFRQRLRLVLLEQDAMKRLSNALQSEIEKIGLLLQILTMLAFPLIPTWR